MSLTQSARPEFCADADRRRLRRGERWRLATLQRWRQLVECLLVLLAGLAVTVELRQEAGPIPFKWALLAAVVAALAALNLPTKAGPGRLNILGLLGSMAFSAGCGGVCLLLIGLAPRDCLDWVIGELVASALLLGLLRLAFAELIDLMQADGRLATHVAVVGDGALALRIAERLGSSDPISVSVVGRYSDQLGAETMTGPQGDLRTLLCDCRQGVVDAIVLAPEPDDEASLRHVQSTLQPCVQDIYLAADLTALAPANARVFALGATPLLLVSERPISGWGGIGKIVFDKVVACLLLAFLAPLLGFIAIAIKAETRGPILFRQLRVGYNNQLFHIYKFRSMHRNLSDRLAKQQTVLGDKRVTRVGRIIRRLSLDELPQLLNVVRGEMSLVGPRPHAPGTSVGGERVHKVVDDYACRHRVRPGITGLAQVRGQRGVLQTRQDVADRLASDLEYIATWSFSLDVKIMVLTTMVELRGSNAF